MLFFFFNDPATTEIYTLSLHDALPISIDRAKQANMPTDNIDRAVKKGTGELEGVTYEEFSLEGYGQGGVAIMVDVLTDNKNRTTAEIRNIFSKKNGNIAGAGSVSWIFEKKGYIEIDKNAVAEDKVMDIVLNAGAQDMERSEERRVGKECRSRWSP